MTPKARPLHIVFLDSWHADLARGSGSAVAISGLAAGLRERGHVVTIVRPARELPSLDLTRLAYNRGLGRRLRNLQQDLVVGFDLDGCFLAPDVSRPYVVALKGVMADELTHEAGAHRMRFTALSRLERRNARRADRVIVTSRYSRDAASRAYGLDPARVHIVPEGIDVAAWSELPADDRPSGSPPAIISVARQYRRKNTASLIRAMLRVRREVPDARLRVVGDGPELPRLRSLAVELGLHEGCVSFAGALGDRAAVQREMARADVFCLPSRQEGFGIVLLEAMAAGLPIVAADAGATPEVAPHGEVALLVPPDDVDALARSLVRVLRDPGLGSRLSATATHRWRGYAWPSVAQQFLAAALAV